MVLRIEFLARCHAGGVIETVAQHSPTGSTSKRRSLYGTLPYGAKKKNDVGHLRVQ